MSLKVGFAKANIDPPLGIGMRGYFIPRYAKGAFDEGGYEARTSDYTSVITEEIVKCGKEILAELR